MITQIEMLIEELTGSSQLQQAPWPAHLGLLAPLRVAVETNPNPS